MKSKKNQKNHTFKGHFLSLSISLLSLSVVGLPSLSAYAEKTGNGGGAWVCKNNDATQSIRWARLVDLYEAQNEFQLSVQQNTEQNYQQIIDSLLMNKLHPVDSLLYRDIKAKLELVMQNLVSVNSNLEIVDDGLFRIRPANEECTDGSIVYIQLANFTNYGKVLLQSNLFNNSVLSETDKAALFIHEAVYAYFRDIGDLNSVRARQVVGLLFSNLVRSELKNALGQLIKGGVNSSGMRFVPIQGATFMLGNAYPEWFQSRTSHKVQITYDYEMQATHVTQEQYFEIMGDNPSFFKKFENCPATFKAVQRPGRNRGNLVGLCPTHPVEQVSYRDANEFADRLTVSAKDGYFYRLPTDAEWELAARGGSSTKYSFGDDPRELPKYGWFKDNSGGQTHPVGQLRPNAFGLYDMQGNVWQWVVDWSRGEYDYADPNDTQVNPVVLEPYSSQDEEFRLIRGCDYDCSGNMGLSSIMGRRPNLKLENLGFRLLRGKLK